MCEIENYVYYLAYPDNVPFYVGTGIKDRVTKHVQLIDKETHQLAKHIVIEDIHNAGMQVITKIIHYDTRDTCLQLEAYIICEYGNTGILTNIAHNRVNWNYQIHNQKMQELIHKKL